MPLLRPRGARATRVVAVLVLAALAGVGTVGLSPAVVEAAPTDIVAVVVDGVGIGDSTTAPTDTPSVDADQPWTRILDADDLAVRYRLGSLTSASVVASADPATLQPLNVVVLVGSNGVRKQLTNGEFFTAHSLPSPRFSVRVVTRDTIGGNVAFIGDSVGNSVAGPATGVFRTLTDGMFSSLTVDVLDGRFVKRTPPAASGIVAANALPPGLDLVIVELGYNPSTTMAADIDTMMSALAQRGAKRVVWVNMAEVRTAADGSSLYAAANAALRVGRERWSNLEIADWNQASAAAGAERLRWMPDGVHLNPTGRAQFSLWLRQVIGGNGPNGTAFSPPSRRFAANERLELRVVGETVVGPDGVARTIPAGTSAVALNITAVGPAAPGYMTVWPCDVARPVSSNVNFVAGSVVANGVIAPVGASGRVCFYSNQPTDFLVDVAGWFATAGGGPAFVGVTPRRILDTRNGIGGPVARIAPGGVLRLPLAGAAVQRSDGSADVIPPSASAVALNVTAVGPAKGGYFTLWPCDAPMPIASNVNFTPGSIVANGVIAPLGTSGSICVYSDQSADVLVDVLGWFGGGGQPPFVGAVPVRVVDTRNAIGGPRGVVTPAAPRAVPVRGVTVQVNGTLQQVPPDASAVALNVTMVDARAQGYATVWPCGTPRPEASNVNFARGGAVANGVVAPIGPDGSICVFTSADADLLVDIAGWFTGGASASFTGSIPKRLVDTRNKIGPGPT